MAGIVLAGGRSTRMGRPKAELEWHGSTLLRRITGLLARTGPVVVVRAPGQPLPTLPASVEVVDDARDGRGPLQGMLAGLSAVAAGGGEAAFLASTDLPLLHPAFVRCVVAALGTADVAVPVVGGHRHPLTAAYRTEVLPLVAELVANDRMRPAFLFERTEVAWLDEPVLLADPALGKADPALDSVRNINTPDDYADARALSPPEVVIERFGTLRRSGPAEATVRAATLGQAVAAAGLALDRHLIAALNGDQVSRDPELPLAAGDAVQLMTGDAGG